MGQLHERPGRRVGLAVVSQLELAEAVGTSRVAQGAVADQEHSSAGARSSRARSGAPTFGREPLHAAGHLPVAGVEDLASTGVEGAHDEAVRVAEREGEQVEAGDADHRQAQGVGDGLAGAMPTRRPVNRPGPRSTATATDVVELHARLLRHELDGGRERLGVAAAAGGVERRQHALVPADGAAHLLGGRVDAEDDHSAPPSRSRAAPDGPPAARGRPTGRRPAEGAVVVAVAEGEAHLEEVGRQHRQDGVAPFDEHHAALVEHLGQPEVEDLLHLLEPVHVEVVEGEPARVHVRRG